MILVDANIILRYLLQDNEQLFEKAQKIIENQEILVLDAVIAEVVYVLKGVYKIDKKEIAESLITLFDYPNITILPQKSYIIDAFRLYENNNLDFVDILLCVLSQKYEVMTFDKKLQKCINKD